MHYNVSIDRIYQGLKHKSNNCLSRNCMCGIYFTEKQVNGSTPETSSDFPVRFSISDNNKVLFKLKLIVSYYSPHFFHSDLIRSFWFSLQRK